MSSSGETQIEPLVPERPALSMPARWAVFGTALLIAFVLLGLVDRALPGLPVRPLAEPARIWALMIIAQITHLVPYVGAIVMVWLALARPQWSDRFLWSAALILTSAELAPFAAMPFHHPGGSAELIVPPYPNPATVTGLIGFGTWLLIVDRGNLSPNPKRALGILMILGLLTALVGAVFAGYGRLIDAGGALLFAGACWCYGVFLAER